jgi:hypothetical protein
MLMNLQRTVPSLALVVALAAAITPAPAGAQQAGDMGAGVYQASDFAVRSTVAYATFGIWAAPEFLIQFGLTFSTADAESFGFMTRATYTLTERGDAKLVVGGAMEIFEIGNTFVGFAPIAGIHYDVTDEFSINLDGLPFTIGNINKNTEASFLGARIGAAYWFN